MQNPETVSSVMRSKGEVLTIRWDATILEAAKLMREHGVGCLVAVYPDGRVAAGPPPQPLFRYQVRVQNGHIQALTRPLPIG